MLVYGKFNDIKLYYSVEYAFILGDIHYLNMN